jgi:isoquinoline 1-oxidoreductase beta subunit
MQTINKTSRRDFLKVASLTSGGLLIGFNFFGAETEAPAVLSGTGFAGELEFNSYLSIGTDGTITIFSPNPELGQNIMTSFPMIVAEELDADWNKVKVLQGPIDAKRFDRQVTGGSGAIPHSWKRLRTAGATARYLLIAAAAKRWNVDPSECKAEKSFVIHSGSGKKLSFGELAEEASKITAPADVPLKDPKNFKLIGTAVRNVENKNIITGKPIYGSDLKRDGMVVAVINRPPAFGTKIKSVDAAAAKAMPGIIDVVTFKNNVAIVGKSTWSVIKARKAVNVEYEKDGSNNIESTSDHNRIFDELLNGDKVNVRRKDGDVDAAFKNAAKVLKAEYQCPFLPHSPMEPMNFFADVKEDSVELIGPTQVPGNVVSGVARLLNVPAEKVNLTITRLGGGFGRRLKTDYALEVAELSSIIKKPVKLIWTREDEITGGSYRPAVKYRFEAALDAKGNMIAYKLRGAGINAGNSVRENNFPSGSVDNLLIESADHSSPITTGAWRAPITNFLAYAEQSFIDEVATAAGKDPIQFRLDLIQKAKTSPVGNIGYNLDRMETVIKTVRDRSGWGKKKGVSQGFSVYFSHNSYVGQVCEVAMKDKKPMLGQMYVVADCGIVVNKTGAEQMVRGGVVDGLGHAMYSKLSFKDGAAEQNNFINYRLIRMKEIVPIDVHFIDNGMDPTGLGEPALPPTGGAVANAVFKATGQRMRSQPFIDEPVFGQSRLAF